MPWSFFIGKNKMPKKPKRPCSYPGCPKLVDGRFCEEHAKLEARNYERYERNPETKARYRKDWIVIRKIYADAHPLCELCLEQGRYTPTEHIHHKKPLSMGGTHELSNLQALCKSCHSRVHCLLGDRWHRGAKNL